MQKRKKECKRKGVKKEERASKIGTKGGRGVPECKEWGSDDVGPPERNAMRQGSRGTGGRT